MTEMYPMSKIDVFVQELSSQMSSIKLAVMSQFLHSISLTSLSLVANTSSSVTLGTSPVMRASSNAGL